MSTEEEKPTVDTTKANTDDLHKLANQWSLWYLPEGRQLPGQPAPNMNDLLRKVDSFTTVEEFWSVYNALPTVDKLSVGEQFMFFRDPTQPMWEDPTLQQGESFAVWTDHVDAADNFIQIFLAGMLGESFTGDRFKNQKNVIAGLRYSARMSKKGRQFKMEVWTTDTKMHEQVENLVKEFCDKAGVRNPLIFAKAFG